MKKFEITNIKIKIIYIILIFILKFKNILLFKQKFYYNKKLFNY